MGSVVSPTCFVIGFEDSCYAQTIGQDLLPGRGQSTAADPNKRLTESAWNFDIMYTIQSGKAKDTTFKLHYTRYDNHSNIPSLGGGYNNVFQDEKDIKFVVIAPFTIF